MKKREIMTRILEEGKRVFENGGAVVINGMLLNNCDKTSEMSFDYERTTGLIKAVYVYSAGHMVICVHIDEIEKIRVSSDWCMFPGIEDAIYGYINGKRFSCE